MPSAIPRGLPAPICAALALAIRHLREEAGLSLGQLANRSGLSRQMLSMVERGMRNPTADSLGRISWALGLQLSQLVLVAERYLS